MGKQVILLVSISENDIFSELKKKYFYCSSNLHINSMTNSG